MSPHVPLLWLIHPPRATERFGAGNVLKRPVPGVLFVPVEQLATPGLALQGEALHVLGQYMQARRCHIEQELPGWGIVHPGEQERDMLQADAALGRVGTALAVAG